MEWFNLLIRIIGRKTVRIIWKLAKCLPQKISHKITGILYGNSMFKIRKAK
jgi:hypothetical protein